VIWKEQPSRKRIETRVLNVCQSGPSPEYVEDLEKDETPVQTCEVKYEQGDRLFVIRILLESIIEDIYTTSMTSQKLTEGVCRVSEAQRTPFTLPNYVRGFRSVFTKEDFNILPEHRQWDYAIKLIPGLEPKSSKVYPLSLVEQRSWTPS